MKTVNLLFVGNSYTYYNKLWDLVYKIAKCNNNDVKVDEVTNGGWSLAQMADSNDEYGKKLLEKLNCNKYDYIILQEQSLRPVINKELFYDSVRKLHTLINNQANIYLYETWGRKKGNIELKNHKLTNKTMSEKLIKSYSNIAKELSIGVCHVGKAFYNVNKNYDIELYHEDKTHPSYIGSFLAALVIYKTIFKTIEVKISNDLLSDEKLIEVLQEESNKVI